MSKLATFVQKTHAIIHELTPMQHLILKTYIISKGDLVKEEENVEIWYAILQYKEGNFDSTPHNIRT